MKNLFLFFSLFMLCISMMAQSVTLTFTGKDANNNRVQLDRVSITNLTKGWQETIYWPDTTLTMQNGGTGIDDYANNGGFVLSQNNPNPFNGTTDVLLTVADAGAVTMEIMNANGRMVVETTHALSLPAGTHQFRITLSAAGTYVMTARQNGKSSSIKMVNNGGGNGDGIEYAGIVETMCTSSLQPKSHTRGNTTNPFNFGDMMEYVGYATINGTEYESERITQMQGASQTFALVFAATQGQTQTPMVSTAPVTGIASTSAIVAGNVLSDGGFAVIDRGICWNSNGTPTLNDNCLHIGNGTGEFSDNLTGLSAGTTYYVRAYAINSEGTGYGNVVSFTTSNPSEQPFTVTTTVISVDSCSATCGGEIISNGGITVASRGVCWGTLHNPLVYGDHISNGNGTGSFSCNITGLTSGTIYYVRAYAADSVGTTYYGNESVFTTLAQLPTVTTAEVNTISATSATCGGEVTYDGGGTVTARGVCWSTSQDPTIADSHTTDGSGIGIFNSSITGLVPATTYYVRAYATNSAGTSYGQQKDFTTPGANDTQPCPGTPTLTDIDGNVYNTVMIGRQCWMKENLRTTRYADNTDIPAGSTQHDTLPYRFTYNNDESTVATYGYLYNWAAVMHGASSSEDNPSGVQGVCPSGWHVPSNAEWHQLTDYVSSQSQYVCGSNNTFIAKALASTTGWDVDDQNRECSVGNDQSANNATGFGALPVVVSGPYYHGNYGFAAEFWSTSIVGGVPYPQLRWDHSTVEFYDHVMVWICTVRCLRN